MEVNSERRFYRVIKDLWHLRLPNPLERGFESELSMRKALRRIVDDWGGRTGEEISRKHDQVRLCFWDTPGGRPDEAWIPDYMLEPAEMPEYCKPVERDEFVEELDIALGFD